MPPQDGLKPMKIQARDHTPLIGVVFSTIFVKNRKRAIVGLALMAAQAFFYNAIFFTFSQVLEVYYHVQIKNVGWYMLPFAIGNALGPLILGPLFDKIGRKPMIAGTYAISGILLILSGWLFAAGVMSATEQVIAWAVIFFFASSAAGAAYLTVSEVFPVEIRALAIAIFYAFGTAIGGVAAPFAFSALIGTHSKGALFGGYIFAAALMLGAGVLEAIWGVAAEGKSLEDISEPLSAAGLRVSANFYGLLISGRLRWGDGDDTAVISDFWRDESGTTAIEYACIAALVSIAIVGAVRTMGNNLNSLFFQKISSNLT